MFIYLIIENNLSCVAIFTGSNYATFNILYKFGNIISIITDNLLLKIIYLIHRHIGNNCVDKISFKPYYIFVYILYIIY